MCAALGYYRIIIASAVVAYVDDGDVPKKLVAAPGNERLRSLVDVAQSELRWTDKGRLEVSSQRHPTCIALAYKVRYRFEGPFPVSGDDRYRLLLSFTRNPRRPYLLALTPPDPFLEQKPASLRPALVQAPLAALTFISDLTNHLGAPTGSVPARESARSLLVSAQRISTTLPPRRSNVKSIFKDAPSFLQRRWMA